MGIRETLNQNPAVTTGATIAIIVVALGLIVWQVVGSNGPPHASNSAYFSDDDGATYFSDDFHHLAPYSHDGKTAVKAYVYKCRDGKPFVAYLEKYTPEARKLLEAAGSNIDTALMQQVSGGGVLVKAPGTGDRNWIPLNEKAADAITTPHCPNGGNDDGLEPMP